MTSIKDYYLETTKLAGIKICAVEWKSTEDFPTKSVSGQNVDDYEVAIGLQPGGGQRWGLCRPYHDKCPPTTHFAHK